MAAIELGFLEECEPWLLECCFFPSKVGGKPAWLALENLPTAVDLECPKCTEPMIFLCQVYSPIEKGTSEEMEQNFHRTLYVFVCRKASCNEVNNSDNIKVYRSYLPRKNNYYSFDPPEEKPDPDFSPSKWMSLCNFCGCAGDKQCSQCKKVNYCSKEHQVRDWKAGHKTLCQKSEETVEHKPDILFDEFELITETETIQEIKVDEKSELKKFEQFKKQGKTGTLDDVSEKELDDHTSCEEDKVFQKFKKRVESYPDQVIRYSRGGDPLLIAKEPLPSDIPNCEYCDSPRQYEFQIMPQLLTFLKESSLDWGVILVYTCKNNCTAGDSRYKKEFVFKQDVTEDKETKNK